MGDEYVYCYYKNVFRLVEDASDAGVGDCGAYEDGTGFICTCVNEYDLPHYDPDTDEER